MKKGFVPIIIVLAILAIFFAILFIRQKFFALPREVTIRGTVATNYLPQNPDDYAYFKLTKNNNTQTEVLYQQGKNSCANKESEKLGATLNPGDEVEVRGMDYGDQIQICSFAKYYIKLLKKGPPPPPTPSPEPSPTEIQNQGSHISYQLDFVSSTGQNKKLILYYNLETQKDELYISKNVFDPKTDTRVTFSEQIFDFGLQRPIQVSPGKKKFFYARAMAGDSMSVALFDEQGKVINRLEDIVESAIYKKYREKYFNLSSEVKQWNGSDRLTVDFGRFASSDHYYRVEIMTDGSIKNIEKVLYKN